MECNCRSKELYQQYDKLTFLLNDQQLPQTREITEQKMTPQIQAIANSIYENSQIYLPTHIDKIMMQQIYASPLWFYKNYIALNKPCIIKDALDGDIIDKWENPKQFLQITKDVPQISVSLTPDGFADSIKGEYFIQPLEKQLKLQDLLNWREKQSEKNIIKPDQIPYIQHQNSNLSLEMNQLYQVIDQQAKDFISLHFFQGNEPDASNFWMGYSNSVSAMHKDPYENFYTTIVGEKHFTLLPPVSILHLQQDVYKSAKWALDEQSGKFIARTTPDLTYETARWICCNPDLAEDELRFPNLKHLKQNRHHVILQAGDTLYLPSLWYHQVSQTHHHAPYIIAINYWFDMNFNHNYSLYETSRKLKGYP